VRSAHRIALLLRSWDATPTAAPILVCADGGTLAFTSPVATVRTLASTDAGRRSAGRVLRSLPPTRTRPLRSRPDECYATIPIAPSSRSDVIQIGAEHSPARPESPAFGLARASAVIGRRTPMRGETETLGVPRSPAAAGQHAGIRHKVHRDHHARSRQLRSSLSTLPVWNASATPASRCWLVLADRERSDSAPAN
jgi:hypothetical protein